MEQTGRLMTETLETEIEQDLDYCWRALAEGQRNGMIKEEWMKLMEYAQCLLALHESIKTAHAASEGVTQIIEKYWPKEEK